MAQKKERTTVVEGAAVTVMAGSADLSRIALSPNNHQILIFATGGRTECTQWELQSTLEEHGQSVTGLSWGKKTGRLLSCAQDRTAFVWSEASPGRWVPCHVLLDAAVKRGLTSCAWNASEDRVFICSAAFNVAVGRYDDPNPFWSCIVVTPHSSTVSCIAAHPSQDRCIATGSTDCTAKVTTLKGRTATTAATIRTTGWVNALAWNPSGSALAIASHGSLLYIATAKDAEDLTAFTVATVRLATLPLRAVTFVAEPLIVGGGHDCFPLLFQLKGDAWEVDKDRYAGPPKTQQKERSATELARLKFQNESALGQQEAVELPDTRHSNTISSVVRVDSAAAIAPFRPFAFATASMDGRVELWPLGETN